MHAANEMLILILNEDLGQTACYTTINITVKEHLRVKNKGQKHLLLFFIVNELNNKTAFWR